MSDLLSVEGSTVGLAQVGTGLPYCTDYTDDVAPPVLLEAGAGSQFRVGVGCWGAGSHFWVGGGFWCCLNFSWRVLSCCWGCLNFSWRVFSCCWGCLGCQGRGLSLSGTSRVRDAIVRLVVEPLLSRGCGLVRGDKTVTSAGTTTVLGYASDLTMTEGVVSTSGRRVTVS